METKSLFRTACLTSWQTIREFNFLYFANVIYSICSFKSPFALMKVLVAKFRHAHCVAILQCFGCQTPMKCIQCQGGPYAEAMQGSSLLRCSNVMFLHNKCPTRPPYPCIRLALYKVFSDADALCDVQLQTVQIKKSTVSATTPLVQRVSLVTIVTPKRGEDLLQPRLAPHALHYCGIKLCASKFLLCTKYRKCKKRKSKKVQNEKNTNSKA